jgi:PKD repeat protein
MGQRVRLKASFVIPSDWTKEEKAVLLALKKYGAMVADNGNYFSISVTPDDRWSANCFNDLTSVAITNFEVIQTTGPNEGPRSAGAPVADAGSDQTAPVGLPFQLQGAVLFTGAPPVISWKLYSGPGLMTFGDTTLTNTTATFSAPGIYTLELSADDGVHAVAYDAVVITVTNGISVFIALTGTNVNMSWTGGSPPYVLQWTDELPAAKWSDIVTTSIQNASVPLTNTGEFFRVKGQ